MTDVVISAQDGGATRVTIKRPDRRNALNEAVCAGGRGGDRPGRAQRRCAPDLIDAVMRPLLPEIARRGIRVVTNAGGVASLRYDPQGKAYAQMLLDMPIAVPTTWTAEDGILGPAA